MKEGDRWQRRLGNCIRDLRVRNDWTQHELATRLQGNGFHRCSRTLLSHIEAGIATIRGHEIYYLRQVFGPSFESDFWNPYYKTTQEDSSSQEIEM